MQAQPVKDPAYRHYKPKNLAVVRINGRDHYLGRYGTPINARGHRIRRLFHWANSVALIPVAVV